MQLQEFLDFDAIKTALPGGSKRALLQQLANLAGQRLGIDPAAKRYVMLKSRVHWRAGLGDMAKAVIECAGTGVCTSDYSQLNFRRVRRPVFPLDPL